MKLLLVALGVLAGGAASAAELKPGAGADLAGAQCGTCHSTDYIVMNSPFLGEAGWRAEVAKMRSAFGARMDDATAAAITAYLAANYGS